MQEYRSITAGILLPSGTMLLLCMLFNHYEKKETASRLIPFSNIIVTRKILKNIYFEYAIISE